MFEQCIQLFELCYNVLVLSRWLFRIGPEKPKLLDDFCAKKKSKPSAFPIIGLTTIQY